MVDLYLVYVQYMYMQVYILKVERERENLFFFLPSLAAKQSNPKQSKAKQRKATQRNATQLIYSKKCGRERLTLPGA